ncbi:hypothetical protein PBS_03600 [Paraburkholderia sp. 2C]
MNTFGKVPGATAAMGAELVVSGVALKGNVPLTTFAGSYVERETSRLPGVKLLTVPGAVPPVLDDGVEGSSPPHPASAETITAIGSNLSVAFIDVY